MMKLYLIPLTLACLMATLTACGKQANTPTASAPERLFLQQIASTGAIIKWRGTATSACIQAKNSREHCQTGRFTDGGHKEAKFEHLRANTEYRYHLDGFTQANYRFRTAPPVGELPPNGYTRAWILGDSGTASQLDDNGKPRYPGQAKAVMDGFLHYNQQRPLDLILLLGDNAYNEGSDAQWQTAVFDVYQPVLSQSALWPTIGNHEMGLATITVPKYGAFTHGGLSISDSPDSFYTEANPSPRRMPYLDIFTLPAQGEVGGVASGTEQYYSFDYANLHIVSLDSQLSARNPSQLATMKRWLINDLSTNQQDWTIVIFHHPPYTKGSHDSDTAAAMRAGIDEPIITMREQFTPLFEDYGVDMVYSGHSHTYERSYYLHGHRGDAASFNAADHAELNTNGTPASGYDNQTYQQISPSSQQDDKVVYTVAGSAGKVDTGEGNLDHPAHAIQAKDPQQRRGLAELGSVLLEANKQQLNAYFINTRGEVYDTVTINR